MNEKNDYYLFYKKLIRMSLEETIEDTHEYKALYEHYPHITQSIRLRREKERLKNINSLDKGSARLHNKSQLFEIKEQLEREKIFKRLLGESKQEKMFNLRFKFENKKERVSSLIRTYNTTRKKMHGNLRSFNQSINRFLHRKLPPTIFDLGSLDMNEKGLAVREWIIKNNESHQTS
jgi:hypothetical protein